MKKKYSPDELLAQEIAILAEHLPHKTVDYVHSLFTTYPCNFKIVPPRKAKLGDCKYPMYGKEAQITVNGDLSKFQFLITTIHEFAHLKTFIENGRRMPPHGYEWKTNYKKLFEPILNQYLLDKNDIEAIKKHIEAPTASSSNDVFLNEYIHQSNSENSSTNLLKNIPIGSQFEFNGKTFVKGNLIQKKFIIYDIVSKRDYRLSGLASVNLIESKEPTNSQLTLFDTPKPLVFDVITLASLNVGNKFRYEGAFFTVIEKKRTRYICQHTKTKKYFSIHKDAPINS